MADTIGPPRSAPPAWNPSAPATEKYINPADGPGDPFEIYAEATGEYHIYADKTVWVANQPGQAVPSNAAYYQSLASYQAQQAAAAPVVVSSTPQPITGSGGAAPPPASSPPPSNPAPAPTDPSDPSVPTPPPIVGSIAAAQADGYYMQTNESGDARNGQQYYTEEASDGKGYWNMYPATGEKEYVAGPLPVADDKLPLIPTGGGVVVGAPLSSGGAGNSGGVDSNTGLTPGAGGASAGGSSSGHSGGGTSSDPGGADVLGTTSHGVVAVSASGGSADNHYTVQSGDNMSGIAEASGVSLPELESLNRSSIPDPSVIRPGETVDLGSAHVPSASTVLADSGGGGGGSGENSSASSGPSESTTEVAKPITSGPDVGGHVHSPTGLGSGGGQEIITAPETIGFPDKSTYPSVGGDLEKAANELNEAAKVQGWGDTSGSGTMDVAKGVFEVDNETSTDPLKIDDKK